MDGSVGSKLRDARTRRKLSLADVEAETKIRARYLQAIENEEWDELPGDTYARAFIRTYGRYLGLDGDRLAEEQRRSRGAARPGERLPRVDPRPRPVVRRRAASRRKAHPRLVAVLVVALVIVALVVVGLTSDGSSDDAGEGRKAKAPLSQPQPNVGQAIRVR